MLGTEGVFKGVLVMARGLKAFVGVEKVFKSASMVAVRC